LKKLLQKRGETLSDSVGKIGLDLEVTGDLNDQIQEAVANVGQKIEAAFKTGGMETGLKDMLDRVFKAFDQNMKTVVATMSKQFGDILKQMTQVNTSAATIPTPAGRTTTPGNVSATRGPPVKMPAMRLEFDSAALERELENTEALMQNLGKQVDVLQEKIGTLNERYRNTISETRKNKIAEELVKTDRALIKTQQQIEILGAKWDAYQAKLADVSAANSRITGSIRGMRVALSGINMAPMVAGVKGFSAAMNAGTRETASSGTMMRNTVEGIRSSFSTLQGSSQAVLSTLGSGINACIGKVRSLGSSILRLVSNFKKTVPAARKASSAMHSTGGAATGLSKRILTLGNMFKLMLIRMAMRAVISGVRDGFQNLARYSDQVNESLSMLMSSLTQLKNSLATAFAPILNAIAPMLSYLINLLSQAMTAIGQFFAALTGQKTFVVAQKVQQNYRDSLDATSEKAKELQRDLMGFDEINKLSDHSDSGDSGGGVSPADMFDTAEVESRFQGLADKVKEIFGRIFQPFKESWAAEGQNTINAAKFALSSIWELVKSIGSSFLDVWTNGTGTKTLATMHQIIQKIFETVGNLAARFREAWETNDVGKRIIQGIFDLLQTVLDSIKRIATATAEWAKEINFTPLLEGIRRLIDGMKPVLQTIGDTLSWIWETFVLPFLTWLIETALPNILDALSGLFSFLGENKGIVEDITTAIVVFFAAFKIASIISAAVGAIGTFISALNPVTLAIAAIIAIGVLVAKHWEDIKEFAVKIWTAIKEFFGGIIEGIGDFFRGLWENICSLFSSIGDWFSEKFTAAVDGIKSAFKSVGDFFKGIWEGIKSTFSSVATWFGGIFSKAWEAVKKVFSVGGKIFDGIKDGILSALKTVINAIIDGLNKVIALPFNGINSALDKLRNLSLPLIGAPFGWLPSIGVPQIPKLARGGVVDEPTLAMVGERGKEAVMPLENNTGWIDSLAGKIAGRLGDGGSTEMVDLLKQLLAVVMDSGDTVLTVDSEELARANSKGAMRLQRRYGAVKFS